MLLSVFTWLILYQLLYAFNPTISKLSSKAIILSFITHYLILCLSTYREAQPRLNEENAQIVFEKGRGIQQDFADSFTGK